KRRRNRSQAHIDQKRNCRSRNLQRWLMTIEPRIVNDVLDAFEAAIQAVRNHKQPEAQWHAENIKLRGQLLAIQPQFITAVHAHCPTRAPADLIESAALLLHCLSGVQGDASTNGHAAGSAPSLAETFTSNGSRPAE